MFVWQVLQKKTLGQMFVLGPHLLRKVANMQKSNELKKLYLAYFFIRDYKIASFQKTENITPSVFEKRLTWCFQICDKLVFLITFKKYARHSFFNVMYFWTFATFRNKWGPKTNIAPKVFFCKIVMYKWWWYFLIKYI